ncbi:hypothetical protein HMPREF0573_10745 [Mobiluncus curtisii ATCC 43063]|uniref:Uncharacterized protein n=1 Tax=Mobiluncus curtisii (strain ATCC 43063 / DSM 2711 / V125) TaxID=548479 RepID=D6ZK15_MOBCV|nr:hypothetical protein HMPREF0573_10745 [Mobiluncus curtisii ATCC 43063]
MRFAQQRHRLEGIDHAPKFSLPAGREKAEKFLPVENPKIPTLWKTVESVALPGKTCKT